MTLKELDLSDDRLREALRKDCLRLRLKSASTCGLAFWSRPRWAVLASFRCSKNLPRR
jgi:hypothetical protein